MTRPRQSKKRVTLPQVMDYLVQMNEVIAATFAEQDRKFTGMIQQLDQKFTGMIGQLEAKMLRRFDDVDQRFDRLEARVGALEVRT